MTTTRAERLVGARSVFEAGVRAREVQRVVDTLFLVEGGFSASDTATRAGFPSVAAASRYMYRHGQPSLARWFEADRRKRERS